MNIDKSNINLFVDAYQLHQKNMIQNKKELNVNYQKYLSTRSEKDYDILRDTTIKLKKSIQELKTDLQQIKKISSDDELADKVARALHSQEIFSVLDSTREIIGGADELCNLSYETIKKKDPSFKLPTEVVPTILPTPIAEQVAGPGKKQFNEGYALFDQLWTDKIENPEDLFNFGKSFLASYQKNPQNLEILNQAHQCWEKAAEIFEKQGNFQRAFEIRGQIITQMKIPGHHPLYNLEAKINNYINSANIPPNQGAKFDKLDTGALKRGLLSIRMRNFDGKEKLVSNFHINKVSKVKLDNTIKNISQNREEFMKALPAHLKGEVTIREVKNGYFGKKGDVYSRDLSNGLRLGEAIEVQIGNIGLIRIAEGDHYLSMANRIVIEIDPSAISGESINRFQDIATLLGLGPIFRTENLDEEERKKITLLFRSFFPTEAYELENTQKCYEISPENLKQAIIDIQPKMKDIFELYLSRMQKVEIAQGCFVWSVTDLADLLRKEGAIGLMSGFVGDAKTLQAILTQGSLCSQERFEIGDVFQGTSPGQDHIHGGGGHVFTRLINQKMVNTLQKQFIEASGTYEQKPASFVPRYPFFGDYQLIYDLSALNVGAYAYSEDYYGSKTPERFAARKNLIDFAKSLNENSIKNEVMIRERIPPSKLKKILVSNPYKKEMLIESMKEEGMTIEKEGKLYLKGYEAQAQDLDQLIIIGKYFTEDMWK